MADTGQVDPAVLRKFAQKLAGNEKKFRDRAVKKLGKWLATRCQGDKGSLTRDDLLKIWKGLHYCMWMSDKPIVQEELAVNLSQLVHNISNVDAAIAFTGTFFQTEAREWFNIDRLRLDKFMSLIRKCLYETFVFLRKQEWASDQVKAVLSELSQTVISPEADSAPEGLKLHIADIYIEELTSTGAEELTDEQVSTFLDPYCLFISKVKSTSALHRVIKEVFFPLVAIESERLETEKEKQNGETGDEDEEEEEEVSLKVDYTALADRLFSLASSQECRGKNRKSIYSLVKTFRNLAQGIPPEVQEVEGPPEQDPIDYNAAMQRLKSFEEKLMLKTGKDKSRKRKKTPANGLETESELQIDETHIEDEQEQQLEEPPKKKKKKAQKELKQKSDQSKETPKENGIKIKEQVAKTKGKEGKKKKNKAKKAAAHSEETTVDSTVSEPQQDKVVETTKKKKKKDKNVTLEVNGFHGEEPEQQQTPVAKKSNIKKMKKPERSVDEDFFVSTPMTSTEKTKKKRAKQKTPQKQEENSQEGEIEIFVPNKKYKGAMKDGFEKEMKLHLGLSTGKTAEKSVNKAFAQFESGKKTPMAFVRRAFAKVKAPNSEPKKAGAVAKTLEQEIAAKKRRVSFGLDKNCEQDFADSLVPSPVVAFNPHSTPDKTILKKRPKKMIFDKKQKIKSRYST